MKYRGFDIDRFVNGNNADPNNGKAYIPPPFNFKKKPETYGDKLVKNLIWSAKFFVIGVALLYLIRFLIILFLALSRF